MKIDLTYPAAKSLLLSFLISTVLFSNSYAQFSVKKLGKFEKKKDIPDKKDASDKPADPKNDPAPAMQGYAVKTFGKFEKVKSASDKPSDFKTDFGPKAQVFVELIYPATPEFFTINCYQVMANGREKLAGTTDIKYFETIKDKTVASPQSLGMMYNAGKYRIEVLRQSDKAVVAQTNFTVTDTLAQPARTVAEVKFSDDTDDNFNPINPTTSIKKGDGVNFSAKLKEGLGAKFFIWAVFEIKDNGDEVLWRDLQMNVDNETNRWFATTDKTYFSKSGNYAVYMLPQNGTNSGTTVNKPTTYYAKGTLTVK
jgi:hypothetical protein